MSEIVALGQVVAPGELLDQVRVVPSTLLVFGLHNNALAARANDYLVSGEIANVNAHLELVLVAFHPTSGDHLLPLDPVTRIRLLIIVNNNFCKNDTYLSWYHLLKGLQVQGLHGSRRSRSNSLKERSQSSHQSRNNSEEDAGTRDIVVCVVFFNETLLPLAGKVNVTMIPELEIHRDTNSRPRLFANCDRTTNCAQFYI